MNEDLAVNIVTVQEYNLRLRYGKKGFSKKKRKSLIEAVNQCSNKREGIRTVLKMI